MQRDKKSSIINFEKEFLYTHLILGVENLNDLSCVGWLNGW